MTRPLARLAALLCAGVALVALAEAPAAPLARVTVEEDAGLPPTVETYGAPAPADTPDCAHAESLRQRMECVSRWSGEQETAMVQTYGGARQQVRERHRLLGALERAQRAWRTYRDLHCDGVGRQFKGGLRRSIEVEVCRGQLAAARRRDLETAFPRG